MSVILSFCVGMLESSPTDSLVVITEASLEDVKKLKVCIELNGLRLNKPRLPGEFNQWFPTGQRSAEANRKFRTDVPSVRARSDISEGWCEPTFTRRDGTRGKPSNFAL